MKKNLLGIVCGIACILLPILSHANGVVCQVTEPLRGLIFLGSATTFEAVCYNNTHDRNYNDFALFNAQQTGVVSASISCGGILPVGGSCTISGVFAPVSTTNTTFTFGLHYGGTDYPVYGSLTFSTRVRGISFISTTGPNGGDITAFSSVPSTSSGGLFYALGTNLNLGVSDIYRFANNTFVATNFPLSKDFTTPLLPSQLMASDAEGNLYVGSTPSNVTTANDVWKYFLESNSWASTSFTLSTSDPIIFLATNNLSRAYAVTQSLADSHTEVWEYDPIANTWMNTGFNSVSAGNIVSFNQNQKPTYLLANSNGNIYAITSNLNIWQYTPSAIAGGGLWISTQFASQSGGLTPRSLSADSSGNVYAGTLNGLTYDIWQFVPGTIMWSSTNFTATGATEPPYPSFLADESGKLFTTGLVAGVINVYQLDSGVWTSLSFPAVANAVSMSLQTIDENDILYVNDLTSTNVSQIWSFNPIGGWLNLNFPSATNNTQVLFITLNSLTLKKKQPTSTVLALQTNGLYELNGITWNEKNGGLFALTTNYTVKDDGNLFTLNARQASSPACMAVPGYDPVWSDIPANDGFIDAFVHPLSGTWSDSFFPAAINSNYLLAPLVTHDNRIFGISLTQTGSTFDVWEHQVGWFSTNFPALAGNIFFCGQGALTPDHRNRLYAITHNGGIFNVWQFHTVSLAWTSTNVPGAPTSIRQLVIDWNNNLYAIVENNVYFFNRLTQLWSNTNFVSFLNGQPKHLITDRQNNVYAVADFSDVWKYNAATQSWASDSLHFPTAQAGIIYRNFFADRLQNLYARTRNGTTDSVWQYRRLTGSWRDLALLPGYPAGAVIHELVNDEADNIFLASTRGLYVFAGIRWLKVNDENTTRFVKNDMGAYYQVTNNKGVLQGVLT